MDTRPVQTELWRASPEFKKTATAPEWTLSCVSRIQQNCNTSDEHVPCETKLEEENMRDFQTCATLTSFDFYHLWRVLWRFAFLSFWSQWWVQCLEKLRSRIGWCFKNYYGPDIDCHCSHSSFILYCTLVLFCFTQRLADSGSLSHQKERYRSKRS